MSSLKHEFQARHVIMVIMVNNIASFTFVDKLQRFQGFLKPKKRTKGFSLKFG